jgi:hypothetical protein
MIQRIQTAYLIIAFLGLIGLVLHTVFSVIGAPQDTTEALGIFYGQRYPAGGYALLAALVLTACLTLYAIFKFKRRMKQIRLVAWAQLLVLLAYIAIAVPVVLIKDSSINLIYFIGLILVFLFLLLARKAIVRDERLVRAADRIR